MILNALGFAAAFTAGCVLLGALMVYVIFPLMFGFLDWATESRFAGPVIIVSIFFTVFFGLALLYQVFP